MIFLQTHWRHKLLHSPTLIGDSDSMPLNFFSSAKVVQLLSLSQLSSHLHAFHWIIHWFHFHYDFCEISQNREKNKEHLTKDPFLFVWILRKAKFGIWKCAISWSMVIMCIVIHIYLHFMSSATSNTEIIPRKREDDPLVFFMTDTLLIFYRFLSDKRLAGCRRSCPWCGRPWPTSSWPSRALSSWARTSSPPSTPCTTPGEPDKQSSIYTM